MSCHCAADWPASRPSFSPIKISGPFSFLGIHGFYRCVPKKFCICFLRSIPIFSAYAISYPVFPLPALLHIAGFLGDRCALSRWVCSFRGVLLFVTSVVLHCRLL